MKALTKLRVIEQFEATLMHTQPPRREVFKVGDEVVLLRQEGGHDIFARFPPEKPQADFITTELNKKTEAVK